MKVVLIARRTLDNYDSKNSQTRIALANWLKKVQNANWDTPHSIKHTFRSADLLGKGTERAVFNIGGNRHRIICRYHFGRHRAHLYVKWIGTHATYTKLCRSGKQFTVNDY